MKRPNLRQVEAFRALVITGSTTRAAEAMSITQPAVSRLVRELQESLELTLFERRGTRLVPTREGLALYAEVERSFVGLDRIAASARDLRERRSGVLRVAAMPALANGVLPRYAATFLAQRPHVDLAIFGLISVTVLDWVVSEQCDVGFAAAPIQHALAQNSRMPPVHYVAALPRNHRLAKRRVLRPRDLADETFISIGPTVPSRFRVEDVFSSAGITRRVRVETPLSEIACALVASGVGVAIVDPFTAAEYSTHGVAAIAFEPKIEFQVAALRHTGRSLPPVAQEFVDGFAAHIAAFRKDFAPAR